MKDPVYSKNLNLQDDDGNTPLHIACQSQRHDIIELLFEQPMINDTILNSANQQPIDMIKNNPNLFNFVQLQRVKYVESISSQLRKAFTNRSFDQLNKIYSNPRNLELLDINGIDPETGDTVLHEFIKKRDIEMVQWILNHNGDPFKRDKRGKLPIDILSRLKTSSQTDTLRKLLKRASKTQSVIDPISNTNTTLINSNGIMEQAPTYKGYLKKWTNFASGYKLRWFILDSQGILSYYKNQDDINLNCRGSINLKNCRLHLDSSEKLKFEILGINNANINWHLKGNHSVETNRWVWAILKAIKFAKDREKTARRVNTVVNTSNLPSSSSPMSTPLDTYANGSSLTLDLNSSINTDKTPFEYTKAPESHLSALHERKDGHSRTPSLNSLQSNATGNGSITKHMRSSSDVPKQYGAQINKHSPLSPIQDISNANIGENDDLEDDALDNEDLEVLGYNDELDSISIDSVSIFDNDVVNCKFIGPYGNEVTILQKTLLVQLKSLSDLVSASFGTKDYSEEERQNILDTTQYSLQNMIRDYNQLLVLIHKSHFKVVKKLQNEAHVNSLWESSIKELEQENVKNAKKVEHYELERRKLRKLLKEKLLSGSGPISSNDNSDLELTRIVSGALHDVEKEKGAPFALNNGPFLPNKDSEKSINQPKQPDNSLSKADNTSEFIKSPQMDKLEKQKEMAAITAEEKLREFVDESSSESDDEFFDLDEDDEVNDDEFDGIKDKSEPNIVEHAHKSSIVSIQTTLLDGANNLPAVISNADETTSIDKEKRSEPQGEIFTEKKDIEDSITMPYEMELNKYQKLKNEVLLAEKTYNGYEDPVRTKFIKDEDDRPSISLWSILKSMVGKDMTKITLPVSFNECTSLLQRVAEGMEYSELLDKAASIEDSALRICYVAAFGASEYASTINRVAKPFNPLLGETFEYARPDKNYRFFVEQVSHHPPISAALAESPKWDYYGESAVKSKFNGRSFDIKPLGKWFLQMRPDKGTVNGGIEELYTWNRVTSSVVGIIIGNPVVDNYGEMAIKNHATGDYVTLNFKARGWRASSAYELKGIVYDKNNDPQYVIKGHWNSKIYAKKITLNGKQDLDEEGTSDDKFLLWQVNPRPPRPFNLTLFSISLNALQPHLKRWLAPTDTRLRPDQRDMEEGRYDQAADEKNRVEEKQRAARKAREEKGITYVPKFFSKRTHPITKDPYWQYNGDYWKKRSGHKLADSGDIF